MESLLTVRLGRRGLMIPQKKVAKVLTLMAMSLCWRSGQYLRQSPKLRLVMASLKF
jgi:hypothetical protein